MVGALIRSDPALGRARETGPFANARAETAHSKPAFRDSFKHRRCLVPANGSFEWRHEGKTKVPYFARPRDGGVFAYAGLWGVWDGPEGRVEGVAILTVAANELIAPLHDRMPAILTEQSARAWLDPKQIKPEHLLPLLAPLPAEEMVLYPVDPKVNSINTPDGPDLIAPVEEAPKKTQPSLFD